METAWKQGDAKKLDALISETFKEPVKLQRKRREDRNPKMAEAVERLLKDSESGFMAVGAAHLVGKKGIVEILKKKGLEVKQIKVFADVNK